MIKVVFMGIPSVSGNYTHFKYLRDNLSNCQFYLLALGNIEKVIVHDEDYLNLGSNLSRQTHQKELARLFLDFCEKEQIDLIIPMNSSIVASCIPFLKKAKVIQIVNTNTSRVYHYIIFCLEYTSKMICISQRQRDVLVKKIPKDVFEKKTVLIPHGVRHYSSQLLKTDHFPLTIGFLGRIHHAHKGVFKVTDILARLSIPCKFEIVGDGQDKERLLTDLKNKNISFSYRGAIPQDKIDEFIDKWDILLFPSQVEGFPLTLIETMSNGVVPLANHLPGITDFIITSGKDGFVIKKNNIRDFVSRIEQLNEDRELLYRMKQAARETVRDRFELSNIIKQYQQVFEEVLKTEKPGRIKDYSEWQPYVEYKPRLAIRLLNRVRKLFNLFSYKITL